MKVNIIDNRERLLPKMLSQIAIGESFWHGGHCYIRIHQVEDLGRFAHSYNIFKNAYVGFDKDVQVEDLEVEIFIR
jgi:hypothetical protein